MKIPMFTILVEFRTPAGLRTFACKFSALDPLPIAPWAAFLARSDAKGPAEKLQAISDLFDATALEVLASVDGAEEGHPVEVGSVPPHVKQAAVGAVVSQVGADVKGRRQPSGATSAFLPAVAPAKTDAETTSSF